MRCCFGSDSANEVTGSTAIEQQGGRRRYLGLRRCHSRAHFACSQAKLNHTRRASGAGASTSAAAPQPQAKENAQTTALGMNGMDTHGMQQLGSSMQQSSAGGRPSHGNVRSHDMAPPPDCHDARHSHGAMHGTSRGLNLGLATTSTTSFFSAVSWRSAQEEVDGAPFDQHHRQQQQQQQLHSHEQTLAHTPNKHSASPALAPAALPSTLATLSTSVPASAIAPALPAKSTATSNATAATLLVTKRPQPPEAAQPEAEAVCREREAEVQRVLQQIQDLSSQLHIHKIAAVG